MTEAIANLAAATLTFTGSHLALSHPPIRNHLVAGLGERGFRVVYALIAIGGMTWLVMAYNGAPQIEIWTAGEAIRWAVLVIMAVAAVLFVCGVASANPTLAGVEKLAAGPMVGSGIYAITRHPVLWSFALWAGSHGLARGDVAALILFGALAGLALLGMAHMDWRRRNADDTTFRWLDATTSAVPFQALLAGRAHVSLAAIGWWRLALSLAVFAAMIALHEPVVGLAPLPW